jgi:hypothetical protein
MLSFFNDFDLAAPTAAQRAAQFLGARGLFPSYHARLDAPLTRAVAAVWAQPNADQMATARRVAAAERDGDGDGAVTITAAEFARLAGRPWPQPPPGPLSRGAACEWLFRSEVR